MLCLLSWRYGPGHLLDIAPAAGRCPPGKRRYARCSPLFPASRKPPDRNGARPPDRSPQGDVVDVLVHDCISLFIPGLRRRSGMGPCRIRRAATSPDSAWAGIYMHILPPQYRSTAGRLGHPYTACRGTATSSCRPWGKGDQSPGDARAAHPFRHPGTGPFVPPTPLALHAPVWAGMMHLYAHRGGWNFQHGRNVWHEAPY